MRNNTLKFKPSLIEITRFQLTPKYRIIFQEVLFINNDFTRGGRFIGLDYYTTERQSVLITECYFINNKMGRLDIYNEDLDPTMMKPLYIERTLFAQNMQQNSPS